MTLNIFYTALSFLEETCLKIMFILKMVAMEFDSDDQGKPYSTAL